MESERQEERGGERQKWKKGRGRVEGNEGKKDRKGWRGQINEVFVDMLQLMS